MKVFGREPRDVAAELHTLITSDAYKNTVGRFITEAKDAFFLTAIRGENDTEIKKALGGAEALQSIEDWIAEVHKAAGRALKKELDKESRTNGRRRDKYPRYSEDRSSK
jgi:hypothetical protein